MDILFNVNETFLAALNDSMSGAVTTTAAGAELSDCHPANPYFNCTVEQFLKFARGPQQLPLMTALLVTIFFVGIFVTGVIGNLIVCVVIVRHATMHTATNYYLFSLAVSDLIFLLLGLPYDISIYWHQYPYNLGIGFCKIRALISEASTYVSVLTIVAFSMERFLAICHPLHLYTMSGLQRAIRIIAGLWIISFLSAVPFAVFTKIDYITYPLDNSTIPDSAFCAMLENPAYLWETSTCIFFAIPMAVMIILYGKMGLQIRSRTRHTQALGVQQGSMHNESRQSQSRKAIIRMLAAVVITFFVCWAPFHAQRLMYLYAIEWEHYNDLNTWMFSIAGWFYYVSCTINPILYNVMSHRYRVAFRETLCGRKKTYYSKNNGFARDQSSFRETTIDRSTLNGGGGGGGGGSGSNGSNTGSYEHSQLLRSRTVIPATRYSRGKDRDNIKTNSVRWNDNTICRDSLKNEPTIMELSNPTADVVVVIGSNSTNGRPKTILTTNAAANPKNEMSNLSHNVDIKIDDNLKNTNNLVISRQPQQPPQHSILQHPTKPSKSETSI